jgi:hypothetical protein
LLVFAKMDFFHILFSCFLAVGLTMRPHLTARPHFTARPVDSLRGLAARQTSMQTGTAMDFSPTELAARAREWVLNDGFHQPAKLELMAKDFVWFGPIVGPLNKKDFLGTVGLFEVYKGFPDMQMALSEFTQDPSEPNRFWGILRLSGTHSGPQSAGTGQTFAPTGDALDVGPQAVSVTFNDQGLVTRYTGGYIVDRRQGSTGEFGGFFAITKAVGGFVPSLRVARVLNWIGAKLKRFPKARSHRDDLAPQWRSLGRAHGVRTEDAW